MPPQASLLNSDPSSFQWLGRAVAVVAAWNPTRGPAAEGYAHMVQDGMDMAHDKGFNSLMVLHERGPPLRYDLRAAAGWLPIGKEVSHEDQERIPRRPVLSRSPVNAARASRPSHR